MKMGEMPSFSKESDSKAFKKFEAPKTRADKEAEQNAKDMEGGANADAPSGSATTGVSYQDFLDYLYGTQNASSAGGSSDEANAKRKAQNNIDISSLPGAVSNKDINQDEEEIKKIKAEIEKIKLKKAQNNESNFQRDENILPALSNQNNQVQSLLPQKNINIDDLINLDTLNLDAQQNIKLILKQFVELLPYRGIHYVLKAARKYNDPSLLDALYSILVKYILNSMPLPKGEDRYKKELRVAIYEVHPGTENPVEQEQGIRQEKVQSLERLLLTMEQFYAGMLSVTGRDYSFAIEIVKEAGKEDVLFYVYVPFDKKELFERHALSVYPDIKMTLLDRAPRVFVHGGTHKMAKGKLKNHYTSPIKTYKEFTHDPMNIILGAFSGLSVNDAAAIQFVIGDDGDKYNQFAQKVITLMRKNKGYKKAISHASSPATVAKDEFKKHVKEMIFGPDNTKPDPIDEVLLEQVIAKSKSKIVPVNLRIVASSTDSFKASSILEAIKSSFNQFENARINQFVFENIAQQDFLNFAEKFTFRRFAREDVINLNITELSTILHLTAAGIRASRELKKSRFKQAAAPIEINEANQLLQSGQSKGIILGKNTYGATESKVPFLEEDRMRHFYEIGQTGTGKTYLMKSMVIQDIINGDGVCYIDPHGTDIIDILAAVPPERADDVIYFDPAYTARPYGLNILEWDPQYPEQKTFVTNELFEIFVKLFGDVPESLGPMFQQYYRNATLLALEGLPAGEATMADIPKVFADKEFRHMLLKNSKNPIVNQFWIDIAEKAQGDPALENVTPYITAKTDTFLANDIMRPIIAQKKSTINFRQIMDERKILLVNLSKGKLGELNAQLLGLIIVGKFLQAALSRVDTAHLKELAPFYLYIDEFQNFTTPSIATILAEARKYRLSLNLAHQFIKQLDEKIRDAVFGNVGTKCVFRVSTEDAEFLEKSFAPEFTAKDLSSLENYNAYLSLLVKGSPVKPFNIQTITYNWDLDYEYAEKLKQLSYLKYGRKREEVEKEIADRYMPSLDKLNEPQAPPFPWM